VTAPGTLLRADPTTRHGADARPGPVGSAQLQRLLTRRLFDLSAGSLVADLAAGPPLSPPDPGDGLTLWFRLRPGACWDAQQARPVVAGDLVRGLKRIALPTHRRGRKYLTDLVAGMADYCAAWDQAFAGAADRAPNAPDLAQFHVRHPVSGLIALDDATLQLRLTGPAPDLLQVLATGFAAAAPREYDYHLPDSHELYRFCPSAGPYRIARSASPGPLVTLESNPRWDPDSDPVARLAAPGRPGAVLGVLVFHRELTDERVRRAIAAVLDRDRLAAAAQDTAGTRALPQSELTVPPEPAGGTGPAEPPPDGNPDGVLPATLRLRVPAGAVGTELARQLTAHGVTVRPADASGWDVALCLWSPDWARDNARAIAGALLRNGVAGTAGDGHHAPPAGQLVHPEVSALVEAALMAGTGGPAATGWRAVHDAVHRLAPVVPLFVRYCDCCPPAADAAPEVCWVSPTDR
jgi:peptide/nickel transport system substrate-binding protein